jgi:hypothetical protein
VTASESIVIDPRYRGPPHSGNGGYVAGLLAARLGGSGDASFRRPVPLGRELQADWDLAGGTATLHDQGELLVELQQSEVAIDAPPPPSLAEATAASACYLGRHARLPFAHCLGCGIERAEGDGLRIFAGPVGRNALYAAPWTPHAAHADENDDVRPEFVWTALDCSGGFALMGEVMRFLVTAWLAVRIDTLPQAGETYVVAAWPVERGARKHKSGTAIYAGDGRVLAVGGALWIEPRG